MYLKALLILASTITAQSVSTNWIAGTADFNYQLSLGGNLLTVWVQKKRPGFLAFGFGSSIENGDIFVIQTNGGGLSIQSCQLAGQQTPVCGGSLWVLQNSSLNSDGSWTAQVTRDITQASASNITITPNAQNSLLYYYGDSPTLDIGQNSPSDMFGTLQAYLGQNVPVSIDSASPVTTNNTGDNTNSTDPSTDPSSGPVFGADPNGSTNGTTNTTPNATTVTNADGSVTSTVVNADGSSTATTVYRNGTIIITTTASNGTVTTNTTTSTNVNSNGTITTNTTVTNTSDTNSTNPTNNGQNNNSGQDGFSGVLGATWGTLLALLVTLSIN